MARRRSNNNKNAGNGGNSEYQVSTSNETCAATKDSKSSRNKNRRGSKSDKEMDKRYLKTNDATWYIKDPELRKQVAGYNMNSTIGMSTKLRYNAMTSDLKVDPYSCIAPSVMTMECNPCPGYADGEEPDRVRQSAINMAARKMYADISSVNAKTTQYQPQDLAFSILAVGEIISMVSHLTRVYGVAFNFSKRNRDIPWTLIRALKVDPDSLDLSHFRIRLNKILVSANQITMLGDIPYFTKCWDMYSNIYTDSMSSMSQLYATVPYSTWNLNENLETGTVLETVVLGSGQTLWTADQWLDQLETMVNNLLDSTTYNYIYTDILNYVSKKGGNLYSFGYVSEMYRVSPIYNLEYLLQIHNATTFGVPGNNNVTQSIVANGVVYTPDSTSGEKGLFIDKLIDFPHTCNPTDEEKINAVAYHIVPSAGSEVNPGSNTYLVAGGAFPDHYPVYFSFYSGKQWKAVNSYITAATSDFFTDFLDTVSKFDWAPLFYIMNSTGNVVSILGDLNFYDVIDLDTLEQTFDYTMLGIFAIPDSIK